jgi:hypothetical protein
MEPWARGRDGEEIIDGRRRRERT